MRADDEGGDPVHSLQDDLGSGGRGRGLMQRMIRRLSYTDKGKKSAKPPAAPRSSHPGHDVYTDHVSLMKFHNEFHAYASGSCSRPEALDPGDRLHAHTPLERQPIPSGRPSTAPSGSTTAWFPVQPEESGPVHFAFGEAEPRKSRGPSESNFLLKLEKMGHAKVAPEPRWSSQPASPLLDPHPQGPPPVPQPDPSRSGHSVLLSGRSSDPGSRALGGAGGSEPGRGKLKDALGGTWVGAVAVGLMDQLNPGKNQGAGGEAAAGRGRAKVQPHRPGASGEQVDQQLGPQYRQQEDQRSSSTYGEQGGGQYDSRGQYSAEHSGQVQPARLSRVSEPGFEQPAREKSNMLWAPATATKVRGSMGVAPTASLSPLNMPRPPPHKRPSFLQRIAGLATSASTAKAPTGQRPRSSDPGQLAALPQASPHPPSSERGQPFMEQQQQQQQQRWPSSEVEFSSVQEASSRAHLKPQPLHGTDCVPAFSQPPPESFPTPTRTIPVMVQPRRRPPAVLSHRDALNYSPQRPAGTAPGSEAAPSAVMVLPRGGRAQLPRSPSPSPPLAENVPISASTSRSGSPDQQQQQLKVQDPLASRIGSRSWTPDQLSEGRPPQAASGLSTNGWASDLPIQDAQPRIISRRPGG